MLIVLEYAVLHVLCFEGHEGDAREVVVGCYVLLLQMVDGMLYLLQFVVDSFCFSVLVVEVISPDGLLLLLNE